VTGSPPALTARSKRRVGVVDVHPPKRWHRRPVRPRVEGAHNRLADEQLGVAPIAPSGVDHARDLLRAEIAGGVSPK
jgi:hypothetical protein